MSPDLVLYDRPILPCIDVLVNTWGYVFKQKGLPNLGKVWAKNALLDVTLKVWKIGIWHNGINSIDVQNVFGRKGEGYYNAVKNWIKAIR